MSLVTSSTEFGSNGPFVVFLWCGAFCMCATVKTGTCVG